MPTASRDHVFDVDCQPLNSWSFRTFFVRLAVGVGRSIASCHRSGGSLAKVSVTRTWQLAHVTEALTKVICHWSLGDKVESLPIPACLD